MERDVFLAGGSAASVAAGVAGAEEESSSEAGVAGAEMLLVSDVLLLTGTLAGADLITGKILSSNK